MRIFNPRNLLPIACVFLIGCSSYIGGGQKVQSLGTDTQSSLSIHYVSGQDQSAAFTQAIETITAGILSTAAASTANEAINAIKR